MFSLNVLKRFFLFFMKLTHFHNLIFHLLMNFHVFTFFLNDLYIVQMRRLRFLSQLGRFTKSLLYTSYKNLITWCHIHSFFFFKNKDQRKEFGFSLVDETL